MPTELEPLKPLDTAWRVKTGLGFEMKLTTNQSRAVLYTGQNLQLIACAGSGKTEVVSQRVVCLLTPGRSEAKLFVRFSVGSRRMFVSKLAMLMSGSCVLLRFVVLAKCVVMPGLMMMMRRGVVVSGRLMMMLTRWMLRHLNFLLPELYIP